MAIRTLIPTEHAEQAAVIQWARLSAGRWPCLKLLHAIPNGGERNKAVAAKLKAEGVLAGMPDLFLPAARGSWHGLYVEMKRQKGGKVSLDQAAMHEALRDAGYYVTVARGFEPARAAIEWYVAL